MRTLEKMSTRLPLQSPRFLLGLLRLLLADGRSQCCSRACRFWRIKPLAMAAAMVAPGPGPEEGGAERRELGTQEREGPAKRAGRRGRGLGALSPAWDPSSCPRSAGPGPQMRPGRGGANAGSPRSCPPPRSRRILDWGRGRGRRRSRRLPARPASRAGGRAGRLLPGQGMEGRCRPGPARRSAQSALGRTQRRTRAAPRPVLPPPALGVRR